MCVLFLNFLSEWGIIIVFALCVVLILGLTDKLSGTYIKEVLISIFSTKKRVEKSKEDKEESKKY